jgi:DNA repair exonuclease SbcCD ATPase subunit
LELEWQVGVLITLLKNISEFAICCPVCGDDFYNHTSDWCDFKKALSQTARTGEQWKVMQRIVEAAKRKRDLEIERMEVIRKLANHEITKEFWVEHTSKYERELEKAEAELDKVLATLEGSEKIESNKR